MKNRNHFVSNQCFACDSIVLIDNNGNPTNYPEEMPQNSVMIDAIGSKSASLPPTPSKQFAGIKRQRKVDPKKFNRSNRESKNFGTFYFKHSDTDPENGSSKNNGNDWSSQDATSELCSDEEEWEYSKGSDVNGNISNGNDDVTENQEQQLDDLSIQVNVNDESILLDTVDSPSVQKQVSFQYRISMEISGINTIANHIFSFVLLLERRKIRISSSINSSISGQPEHCRTKMLQGSNKGMIF